LSGDPAGEREEIVELEIRSDRVEPKRLKSNPRRESLKDGWLRKLESQPVRRHDGTLREFRRGDGTLSR
jgi:hypothetical protein